MVFNSKQYISHSSGGSGSGGVASGGEYGGGDHGHRGVLILLQKLETFWFMFNILICMLGKTSSF